MTEGTLFRQVWRLTPDNFTPPIRTPWGGRKILSSFKPPDFVARYDGNAVVGESWEISVEPSFPSRVLGVPGQPVLADLIDRDPEAALGRRVAASCGGLPLLMKLLDAADNLSVQVHPGDDYGALQPGECGKPEAWLVLAAEPGAGLYLGFRDGVTRDDVQRALDACADLQPLLNFVPVAPGDCYAIASGTVHAVGAGVTLLEPQQVVPGKRGVTYRLWDWNRRYDERGQRDPSGQPRVLHKADSMNVAHFDRTGLPYVESLRLSAQSDAVGAGLTRARFLRTGPFDLTTLSGTGSVTLPVDGLRACLPTRGTVICDTATGSQEFLVGEPFVIPALVERVTFTLRSATLAISSPRPG